MKPAGDLEKWADRFRDLPETPPERATTEIITDLHLPTESGEPTERFIRWLSERERPGNWLCLGDLFDTWVGRAQLRCSGAIDVSYAVAGSCNAESWLDLIPGNRDTLLDDAFEAESLAELYPDGLVLVRPCGTRILCLHGDELCVREAGYLRLRAIMRSRPFRALSRVAPLWFARWVGRRLRSSFSGSKGPRNPERGPQADAALAAAKAAGASILVTGHTHVFEDRILPGPEGIRWVTLGAFGDGRDVGRIVDRPEGATLEVGDATP